jgi:hypothetical protein
MWRKTEQDPGDESDGLDGHGDRVIPPPPLLSTEKQLLRGVMSDTLFDTKIIYLPNSM